MECMSRPRQWKRYVAGGLASVALLCAPCTPLAAGQDVLTSHYTNSRTNANLGETILNAANVKSPSFGKLFTLPVDGQIYVQPLYQQSVAITGKGTQNVVFVTTMHNGIHASA